MISGELQDIVERISEQGKMKFNIAASEEQIAEFEKGHRIKLPKQYREWLLFSDGGECFLPAGVQFYGVYSKPVINVDNNDRPDDNYVVIGALASGDPIVFEKNKESIAIYNQAEDRIEDDERYDDFYSFLNDMYDMLGIGG